MNTLPQRGACKSRGSLPPSHPGLLGQGDLLGKGVGVQDFPKSHIRARDEDDVTWSRKIRPHPSNPPPSPHGKHVETEAATSVPILGAHVRAGVGLPFRTPSLEQLCPQSPCSGQPGEGFEALASTWCPLFKHIHPTPSRGEFRL